MPKSIFEFTQAKFDINDVVVTIDGKRPVLYTDGNIYNLSFAENNINIVTDNYQNGIAIINHNGKATLTISLSRFDNAWSDFIGDVDGFRTNAHEIVVNTPTETITTNSAYIPKVPDISTDGKSAPNVDFAFECINANIAQPQ